MKFTEAWEQTINANTEIGTAAQSLMENCKTLSKALEREGIERGWPIVDALECIQGKQPEVIAGFVSAYDKYKFLQEEIRDQASKKL